MQKFLRYFTVFFLIVLVVISFKIYLNQKEDLSKDDNFKTWIDINKTEFYDNEDINIQLNIHYIGDSEEIDVYIPKYPFSLLITGSNGFQSVLEPPNIFGAQIHTLKKDDIITMDCSSYGYYNYSQAMKIYKGYDQRESSIGMSDELRSPPAKLRLPPGNYTLTLTSWYEDDCSGEFRHELYTTKKITVKAKNKRKIMHETKSTKNFKLEAILDKNIYEVDEYINIWSIMTYCGEEDSIVFPYMRIYPMRTYIYNEKNERLDLDYSIYFNLDEGEAITNDKPLYYAPYGMLQLPKGKYTVEFLFYYPNEDGEIVDNTIEMNFEVVPSL